MSIFLKQHQLGLLNPTEAEILLFVFKELTNQYPIAKDL